MYKTSEAMKFGKGTIWRIPREGPKQNSEKGTILENPGMSSGKILKKVPSGRSLEETRRKFFKRLLG